MKNTWRDIVDYEEHYKINAEGIIFSKISNRIIFPRKTPKGYVQIQLAKPRKKFLLHRLVAIAFIPNPENKLFVNHKNGVRDDNKLSNLEWYTAAENNQLTQRAPRKCPHCKAVLYQIEKDNCRK